MFNDLFQPGGSGALSHWIGRRTLSAAALDAALDDLTEILASRFLHCDPHDTERVFAAFAANRGVQRRGFD